MYYYKNGNSYLSSQKSLDLPEISKEEFDLKMEDIERRANVYASIYEKTRTLTESEVLTMLLKQQINTIEVDDNTALRMTDFYPEWSAGQAYTAGFKVQYGGTLYKCLNAHTSQDDWTPDVSPSLFSKVLIPDENIIPEWEQPDSTNPYMAGDKVTHNGKTWESLVDNNVWEPGATGMDSLWKEV